MKFVVMLSFLISSFAFAQSPRPRLQCMFDRGYLKISDGIQRWEKYVGNQAESQVECGADFAMGYAGPHLITFYRGQFEDKYVGSNAMKKLVVRGHLGVFLSGPNLLAVRAGGRIIDKYIGSNPSPMIEASNSMALILHGPYLLVTDGETIEDKYVGSLADPLMSVGREMGVVLAGSYLLVYAKGRIQDKYIGSRSRNDSVVAGRRSALVAAAVGKYFVIYDLFRNSFEDTYLGQNGQVEVREDGAYHFATDGRITRYRNLDGRFESL